MISGPIAGAGGRQVPAPTRRVALTIWWTLLASVVAFAVVATVVGPGMRRRDGELPEILSWVVLGMALVTFVASRIVPGRVRPLPGATPDAVAVQRAVVAASLNEGSALLAIAVWMASGQVLALVALAIPLAGLLFAFPSEARWRTLCAAQGETGRPPLVR